MTRIIDKILTRRRNYFKRRSVSGIRNQLTLEDSPQQPDDPLTLNTELYLQRPQALSSSQPCNKDNVVKFQPHWYYSFEFFPPKTEAGLENLFIRIERMVERLDPLFIDVTWGDKGSTAAKTLAIASHAQRYCGVDVLLHLTCTGLTREQIAATLQHAKSCGVRNILALRGDPPINRSNNDANAVVFGDCTTTASSGKRLWGKGDVSGGDCDRAIDLVRLIRKLHGDHFCIAVAGHPEGHPSSYNIEEEMSHLKEKIEAGADFIITQFFYDLAVFFRYVNECRNFGIRCPILPGIMPIQSYNSFIRMTEYCGISVPSMLLSRLELVKDDDEAVKNIGCEIAADMCTKILTTLEEDGGVDGVHFYTLNLERSVSRILMMMGALESAPSIKLTHSGNLMQSNHDQQIIQQIRPCMSSDASLHYSQSLSSVEKFSSSPSVSATLVPSVSRHRRFPWRQSALDSRSKEDVRPINWANRPKSYVMRTDDWDEFPNGRWGDATSPAFGELSDISHFYSFSLGSDEDRRNILGRNPTRLKDIYEVFARYVEGDISFLPWCESPLHSESFSIQSKLAALNRAGFLTVNSQPSVNGLPSNDPVFGWGGAGGYVYQKAYCEFFVHPIDVIRVATMVKENSNMTMYAVNYLGQEIRVGDYESGVTALTWGVFPNREILQPTIFDPNTFLVYWAEEAFSLWTTMWINLYDVGSESVELLESIRDTYYLVAIIDNDFIGSSDYGTLWESLHRLCSLKSVHAKSINGCDGLFENT